MKLLQPRQSEVFQFCYSIKSQYRKRHTIFQPFKGVSFYFLTSFSNQDVAPCTCFHWSYLIIPFTSNRNPSGGETKELILLVLGNKYLLGQWSRNFWGEQLLGIKSEDSKECDAAAETKSVLLLMFFVCLILFLVQFFFQSCFFFFF